MDADLRGRRCLVTGATSGIGLATARLLAERGAQVVLLGRDAERTERARAEVARAAPRGEVEVALADLASLSQVRRLARELRDRFEALHVLVANAGVVTQRRKLTEDGHEMMFGVNHLAHFLLVLELLPLLQRGAPARVVIVASDAHRFGRLVFEDLQSERGFGFPSVVSAMRVYGGSKLANLLFNTALARRLPGSGVSVNAVHPGAVRTNLGSADAEGLAALFQRLLMSFFVTPEQGATASLHVASTPSLADRSGGYFIKQREAKPSARARDAEAAELLWQRSCELVGHSGEIAS